MDLHALLHGQRGWCAVCWAQLDRPWAQALVQKSDLAGADFTAKLFQGLSSRKKIFIFGALIAKTNEN